MTAFPWEAVLVFALARLGLPPSEVWAMTPREVALASRGFETAGPPSREAFESLLARYPD